MKRLVMMATLTVATLFSATAQATAPVTRDMFPADADYMGFAIGADEICPLTMKLVELFPEMTNAKQLTKYSEESPIVKRIIDATGIDLTDPYLKDVIQGLTIATKIDVPKESFGLHFTLTGDFNTLGLTKAIYTEVTDALKKDADIAKDVTIKQVANGFTGSVKMSDDDDKQTYDFSLIAKGKTLTLSFGDYTKAFEPISADSAFSAKLPTSRSHCLGYGIAPDLQRTLTTNGVLPLDSEIEFPAQFNAQIQALTRLIKFELSATEDSDAITYKLLITAGSIDDAKSILSTLTMFKGMGMMAASSGDAEDSVIAIAMLNAITLTQPEGKPEVSAFIKFDLPLFKLLLNYVEKLENAGNNPCKCADGCDCDDCECADCKCADDCKCDDCECADCKCADGCNCDDCECADCKCGDDDEDEIVDLDALFND